MKKRIMVLLAAIGLSMSMIACSESEEMMIISSDTEYAAKDSPSDSNESNNEKIAEVQEEPRLFYVVYVCGSVMNPGVYEMPEGSRLFDAISKAGGYSKDAADGALNLAKLIEDEEMIYVPSVNDINSGNSEFAGFIEGGGEKSELININKATKEELMTLSGIGESKAELIISDREENGKFTTIEDIMRIRGIKEGLFNKIKDNICAK